MNRHRVVKLIGLMMTDPTLWLGETDMGEIIYIRYRWGVLSASVDSQMVFRLQIGLQSEGEIERASMTHLLGNVFDFSEV